jgi:two-component system response regulator NreC
MAISILVADDHQLVIDALRATFARQAGIRIVGDTQSGAAVPALVEKLRPDVLLLDLTMPGVDGLDVLRRLADGGPTVPVVILSMHTTASYAARAVKLGALGYVGKNAPSEELVRAIESAARGVRYLAPPLKEEYLREYEQRLDESKLDLYDTLSGREKEVMRLTVLGMTAREIAGKLEISHRTVESYLGQTMAKLGLSTRAELIRYAVRVGLISADGDQ